MKPEKEFRSLKMFEYSNFKRITLIVFNAFLIIILCITI